MMYCVFNLRDVHGDNKKNVFYYELMSFSYSNKDLSFMHLICKITPEQKSPHIHWQKSAVCLGYIKSNRKISLECLMEHVKADRIHSCVNINHNIIYLLFFYIKKQTSFYTAYLVQYRKGRGGTKVTNMWVT